MNELKTYSSNEMKKILRVSDCELMHLRTSGKLKFQMKGRAFRYLINDFALENHRLMDKLLNWYKGVHSIDIDNTPTQKESKESLKHLLERLLIPLELKYGEIVITYGFVSPNLNRFIQKNNSAGTSPTIDQHGCSELNLAGSKICKRGGAACDFIVAGHESEMHKIMHYVVNNLAYDKLYFYGNKRPIHISTSEDDARHLQIMDVSANGRRIPGRKAFGDRAKQLALTYIE